MTIEEAINKVISVAEGEVGYLEKRSNSQLDSKTANAGSANYTKYWRDIKSNYQQEPWCACFVTWVLQKAFGKDIAEKLLKHYPFVYCPTLASLCKLNSNPKRGDIVLFYRNGTFCHTGIVTGVNGDYFTTIEGNTSGGSSIVANGGGVFAKGYYNSNLPGTKFVTPDWSIVADNQPEHWGKEFLDKLVLKGCITDKDYWSKFDKPIAKSFVVALLDKVTGGTWTSDESEGGHWVKRHVISLCGKKIIKDKQQWLTEPDDYITKALLLALVDNATINDKGVQGMTSKYVGRQVEHWGRNHLDSLCDKGIITTPSAWTSFEGQVTNAGVMALLCKAFLK